MSEDFGMTFVNPDPQIGVFLQRCEDAANPEYIVHGKTKCTQCDTWCWLGSATYPKVVSGSATPICIPCGVETFKGQPPVYIEQLQDRR